MLTWVIIKMSMGWTDGWMECGTGVDEVCLCMYQMEVSGWVERQVWRQGRYHEFLWKGVCVECGSVCISTHLAML